ncbi:RloB family protein [Streptococcus infantis]|jgi:abortive phage resistance protein|uniref:RloB family protein n=1 Tax=Streptococcus infantis TaxID=68892 RepID=UPI0039C3D53D
MVKPKFSRDNKTGKKEQLPIILIVCEGERTEPNYFDQFEVTNITIDPRGIGDNTIRLVKYAINESKRNDYDQVWCVFDKDSFPKDNFNNAVQLAQNNDFGIAYSNESFELWYILHFEYLNSQITRDQYIKKLNNIFKSKKDEGFPDSYKKNDPNIYRILKPYQHVALKNAQNLSNNYESELIPSSATQCPVTYVYKLVEELNRWIPSHRLD